MAPFVLYLILTSVTNAAHELFVSFNGTLNTHCSSEPCGSLSMALYNIENTNIITDDIIIYVDGHYNKPFDPIIDCHSRIHGYILIIFNPKYIQSTTDWHPYLSQCHQATFELYGDDTMVTFEHLIFDNTQSLFLDTPSDSTPSITCNHCTFSNLHILANATRRTNFMSIHHNALFIDCLFENVSMHKPNTHAVAFMSVSGLFLCLLYALSIICICVFSFKG